MDHGLPFQLALSTAMVIVTVATHGTGLAVLARLMNVERREEKVDHIPRMSLRALLFTVTTVLALFILHGLEIWAYAVVYVTVGAQKNFEAALYFSTISYGAIGYGDTTMPPAWRMLGAIEGINGVLLLGWSTAFFVNLLARMRH